MFFAFPDSPTANNCYVREYDNVNYLWCSNVILFTWTDIGVNADIFTNLTDTAIAYLPAENIDYNSINLYYYNTNNVYKNQNIFNYIQYPYITNSVDSITSWNLTTLDINSGGLTINNNVYIDYYYCSSENITTINGYTTYNGWVQGRYLLNSSSPFITATTINGNFTASIPKTELFKTVTLRADDVIYFKIGNSNISKSTPIYTLTLSAQATEDSENNKTQQQLTNLNGAMNDVNNSINNQTQAITSTDYNEQQANQDFGGLGSNFNTTDISNLDELFTVLYNAFCTNEVVSVNLTIPFVNKSVTISSANISTFYPVQLVSIVNLFVWGIIGLFVIKDIRGMINKILEGNIENTSSDVKKEVL